MAVKLVAFCGKGGVGKSTLAVGTALALAQAGQNVLVVSSHPIEELALSLSLAGLKERDARMADRFYVAHIDPLRVLESIIRSRVRPARLAELLLGSRIYGSFVEVVPALKEFAFLWRLQELGGIPPAGTTGPFEFLLWDAPASGHFLETLRAAVHFETFFVGPLADQGAAIASFLRTTQFRILPVCIPEEMSIDETLELISSLASLGLKPSAVLCNLVSPLLSREAGLTTLSDSWGSLGAFLLQQVSEERRQYDRMREAHEGELKSVHRVNRDEANLDFLLRIADELRANGLPESLVESTEW